MTTSPSCLACKDTGIAGEKDRPENPMRVCLFYCDCDAGRSLQIRSQRERKTLDAVVRDRISPQRWPR